MGFKRKRNAKFLARKTRLPNTQINKQRISVSNTCCNMCICVYAVYICGAWFLISYSQAISFRMVIEAQKLTAIPLGIRHIWSMVFFCCSQYISLFHCIFMFYCAFVRCIASRLNSSLVSFPCYFIVCFCLVDCIPFLHTQTHTCDQHAALRCLFNLRFRMLLHIQ